MPKRHDTRRLAMQVLYQMDLRGESDLAAIREGLTEGPDGPEVVAEAVAMAEAAWQQHEKADVMVRGLAPQWPTHRQPPVDRALLRLAYYEMSSGHAPAKVAINEAVELAKEFCSEQSPPFINGVLDKMARQITPIAATPENNQEMPARPEDQWLADAMDEPGEPK